jgi:3-isopropylmalate dehydrogenase
MLKNSRPNMIVLPGDGIGPEVIGATIRIVEWFARHRGFDCDMKEEQFGVTNYYKIGRFMREGLMADLMKADVVLFGAMGGEGEHRAIPNEVRRKEGLLAVRQNMQVYANIRPVKAYAALAKASPLRADLAEGVDMVIVRELTGGMYFGEPRGVETLSDGEKRGVNTHVYTTPEVRRIGRVAFELARKRRGVVTSVDKANVMEAGMMWREEMDALHAKEFSDVKLNHLYVDNCAMQIVKNPRQFDVMVTDNLFGDILSDEASTIAGSLGMLPSASLSDPNADGQRRGLYEPGHGSAPDIAGQGKANPIATILSFGMALDLALDRKDDAKLLEDAVNGALEKGSRTADIAEPGLPVISTSQMADAVIAELDRRTR